MRRRHRGENTKEFYLCGVTGRRRWFTDYLCDGYTVSIVPFTRADCLKTISDGNKVTLIHSTMDPRDEYYSVELSNNSNDN